jgi:hypothetical protein
MHRSAIPKNKVARLHVHLDHFAASILKPLEVFRIEEEQIHVLQLWWRCIFVVACFTLLGEEFVKQIGGSLHQHQATIFRSIGCEIQQPLHGLHSSSKSAMVKSLSRILTYPLRSGFWSQCGHGLQLRSLRRGREMFSPSKEQRSSFVPHSFSNISTTPGSVLASHAIFSCGAAYA